MDLLGSVADRFVQDPFQDRRAGLAPGEAWQFRVCSKRFRGAGVLGTVDAGISPNS